MALPVGGFRTRTVRLSGGDVTVRGLSFLEGSLITGEDRALLMVAYGTGETLEDVRAWAAQVSAGDVARLIEAVSELSGFSEDATFPDGAGDDAGPDGPTV